MPAKMEGGEPRRWESQKQRGQSRADWRRVTPSLMVWIMRFPVKRWRSIVLNQVIVKQLG